MSGAKKWAYCGLGWGLAATLAANVAHAVGRDGVSLVPILAATFWPVALFLATELLYRLTFDTIGDCVSGAMVALVGLGSGYISFGHTSALLRSLGESHTGAALGALAVDGLLVVASLALYREARRPVPASQPARPAVPRDSAPPVPAGQPVPPVPSQRPAPERDSVPSQPSRPAAPAAPSRPAVPLHAAAQDAVRELHAQGMSTREIGERLGLSKSTVARRLKTTAA